MTPDEHIQAVQQQREQARIDELVSQGISEEVAQEMLENRKFRDQYEAEKKAKQRKKRKTLNLVSFSTTSVKLMEGNMCLTRTPFRKTCGNP
jgi:SOS response regulatory protein OraA/RecX